VKPPGGFDLDDIANAYIAGALDGQRYPKADAELVAVSAEAYVKSVAVPMADDDVGIVAAVSVLRSNDWVSLAMLVVVCLFFYLLAIAS
jgi:hypothetical protein